MAKTLEINAPLKTHEAPCRVLVSNDLDPTLVLLKLILKPANFVYPSMLLLNQAPTDLHDLIPSCQKSVAAGNRRHPMIPCRTLSDRTPIAGEDSYFGKYSSSPIDFTKRLPWNFAVVAKCLELIVK
jgi:hypothetical protein